MRRLSWGLVVLLAAGSTAKASPFTMFSPTGGQLPSGVTEIGGVVVDILGTNGTRVVSELAASQLYVGYANANPLTIGTQTGFTPAVTGALGGGIQSMSVRFTLYDGDTASGDFDFHNNTLRLNGVSPTLPASDWSNVTTQITDSTGTVPGSMQGGFPNNQLATGFFTFTNPADLAAIYSSLVASQSLAFQLYDTNPYDNYFDFTQGIDGGLINVGQGPTVSGAVPEPATLTALGLMVVGGFCVRRRKLGTA